MLPTLVDGNVEDFQNRLSITDNGTVAKGNSREIPHGQSKLKFLSLMAVDWREQYI
jgi:hypothetical protein